MGLLGCHLELNMGGRTAATGSVQVWSTACSVQLFRLSRHACCALAARRDEDGLSPVLTVARPLSLDPSELVLTLSPLNPYL